MTIRFVWIEFCMLVYECCLSPSMLPTLPTLFNRILQFAFQSETDKKMGELLRILLPILSLFQEGKHLDEKPVRNSQRVLLSALTVRDPRLNNAVYALVQRLIINTPDRVDDRKNTLECLMTLLLSRSGKEKRRINAWILLCARCGIANIRLCAVSLARSLLMSRYVLVGDGDGDGVNNVDDTNNGNVDDTGNDVHNDTHQQDPSAMEIEPSPDESHNESHNESPHNKSLPQPQQDTMEEEDAHVQRELFADEQPLCTRFFAIVLARCNDIVISIRAEAVHVPFSLSVQS